MTLVTADWRCVISWKMLNPEYSKSDSVNNEVLTTEETKKQIELFLQENWADWVDSNPWSYNFKGWNCERDIIFT